MITAKKKCELSTNYHLLDSAKGFKTMALSHLTTRALQGCTALEFLTFPKTEIKYFCYRKTSFGDSPYKLPGQKEKGIAKK